MLSISYTGTGAGVRSTWTCRSRMTLRTLQRLRKGYSLHCANDSEEWDMLFDEKLVCKPSSRIADESEAWGGYEIGFKIIDEKNFNALKGDLERIRRNAAVISPFQKRVFKIQIRKFEFCAAKIPRTIGGCTIYVYTPAMIALEKLRAPSASKCPDTRMFGLSGPARGTSMTYTAF